MSMNLPLKIARRYLFAKKSTNAINIITGISIFGITVQAAAFILVLSVFNGFENLLLSLFSNFNPEIKITPQKGKTFAEDTIYLDELMKIDGITHVSKTIEETAFFEYKDNRAFGTIKGVDDNFKYVNSIDSTIRDGGYVLALGAESYAVLGLGMRSKLRVDIEDDFTALSVYMPKQKRVSPLSTELPFRKQFLYPIGVFSFQQDFDNKYIITNLAFCQKLLNKPNQIGALELKLTPDADVNAVKKKIKKLVGNDFTVKDQYEQEETFLKLMNIEKWLAFAILTLTLFLVAFNIIGSLWMIVLEKKKDISILKSMGIQDGSIRNIFLYEGLLLCGVGLAIGFVLALIFYFLQKTLGLIPIPAGFIVDSYPMNIKPTDFVAVTAVVLLVGLIASIPAAARAKKIPAMVREE
ncbi:MAG: FtsX-like permease family protein [Bacteroidota bacterium]